MDAFVTARVPEEVKLQGNKVLRDIGCTPTQLVNDAYRYVLAHGCLPTEGEQGRIASGAARVVTDAQREEIARIVEGMHIVGPNEKRPLGRPQGPEGDGHDALAP